MSYKIKQRTKLSGKEIKTNLIKNTFEEVKAYIEENVVIWFGRATKENLKIKIEISRDWLNLKIKLCQFQDSKLGYVDFIKLKITEVATKN